MIREDDFQYAMENTRVVRLPDHAIQTFGTTSFKFYLVSELMDQIDRVRIRDGKIHAERPQILSPHHYSKMLLDGFGEDARGFADWFEQHGRDLRFLKYGFNFRKTDVSEEVVHSPMAEVLGRIEKQVAEGNEPMSAVIEGVDDTWEICLLKFSVDMIQRSAGGNVDEWKRRGLL